MLLLALACNDYGIQGVGRASPPRQVDAYFLVEGTDADVAIVLDTSRSMEPELGPLSDEADAIWEALDDPGLRVGMITTDGNISDPLVQIEGTDWMDVDSSLDLTRAWFDRATFRAVGHHSFRWMALQALRDETIWRDGAARHLLFVTDDDDGTLDALSVADFLLHLDRYGVTAHAIAPEVRHQCQGTIDAAVQVLTYVDHTGGLHADPCTAPIGRSIANIAASLTQEQRVFPIERAPLPDTLEARISVVAGVDRITRDVEARWMPTLGAVVLSEPALRGEEVRIRYWVD